MAKSRNMSFHKGSGVVGDFVLNQVNDQTVLKARSLETKIESPKVADQNRAFGNVAQIWNEQGRESRSQWFALGQQMTDLDDNRLRPTLTAYQAFQSVQNSLKAIGANYNPIAPAAPSAPQFLGDVSVTSTLTTTGTPVFTLDLTVGSYPDRVQVFAQAPLYTTQPVDNNGTWKMLGVQDPSASSVIHAGNWYKAVFGLPSLTDKIAVKCVAISDTGFRGVAQVQEGIVQLPAAQSAGDTDGDNEELAEAA